MEADKKIIHGGYLVESDVDLTNELRDNQEQIILWQNFNAGDRFYANNENEYIVREAYHDDGSGYIRLDRQV